MASAANKKRRASTRSAPSSLISTKCLSLERIIGFTSSTNASLAVNPINGDIAYTAGCVVVIYNARKNRQTQFLISKNNKPLSCLAFSSSGRYLAAGETGHQPAVIVWDLTTEQVVAELKGHKYGVACLAFSPNLKYIATVGLFHDGFLYIWDWRAGTPVACNKVTSKVHSLSFSEDGTYIVTAGVRHLKFWYLDAQGTVKKTEKVLRAAPASEEEADSGGSEFPADPATAGVATASMSLLEGRSALLGAGQDHRNATFYDMGCGKLPTAVYCVSSRGLLCTFNSSTRLLDKWVDLKAKGVFALSLSEKYLACACADGIVRLFDAATLEYIATLPKPHALGAEMAASPSLAAPSSTPAVYPDTIACRLSTDNQRLVCLYSDHSLYVWDLKNPKKVGRYRAFLAHSGNIWDVQSLPPSTPLLARPDGEPPSQCAFVTCSADNSIRFWNMADTTATPSKTTMATTASSLARPLYNKELLHVLHVADDYTHLKVRPAEGDTNGGKKSDTEGLRTVRVSPEGRHVASGDRQGNLRVHELASGQYALVAFLEAHDSEILSLDYSPAAAPSRPLLATASRDRLVHLFDVDGGYQLVETLEDHSAAITAVRFAQDGSKLISCSADKSVVFRARQQEGPPLFKRYSHTAVQHGSLYDMDVDSTQKYVVTSGQDRRLNILAIQSGKIFRTYKPDAATSEVTLRVKLDPAGMYMAASFASSVRLYDFYSGECLTKVAGHSELVTGLAFSYDGKRLVSVSGDGCLFVWRLGAAITRSIQERLAELAGSPPLSSPRLLPTPPPPPADEPPKVPKQAWVDLRAKSENTDPNVPMFSSPSASPIPKTFEEASTAISLSQIPFRFSESGLPAWAKAKKESASAMAPPPPLVGVAAKQEAKTAPKGRWAQRLDGEVKILSDVVVTDTCGSASSAPEDSIAATDNPQPADVSASSVDTTALSLSPTCNGDLPTKPAEPQPTAQQTTADQKVPVFLASLEEADMVLSGEPEEDPDTSGDTAPTSEPVGTADAAEEKEDEEDVQETIYYSEETTALPTPRFEVAEQQSPATQTQPSQSSDRPSSGNAGEEVDGEPPAGGDTNPNAGTVPEAESEPTEWERMNNFVKTHYEELDKPTNDFALPTNPGGPCRLSLSRLFFSKAGQNTQPKPTAASLPDAAPQVPPAPQPKPKPPSTNLALEVEKTRQRLAKMGITITPPALPPVTAPSTPPAATAAVESLPAPPPATVTPTVLPPAVLPAATVTPVAETASQTLREFEAMLEKCISLFHEVQESDVKARFKSVFASSVQRLSSELEQPLPEAPPLPAEMVAMVEKFGTMLVDVVKKKLENV